MKLTINESLVKELEEYSTEELQSIKANYLKHLAENNDMAMAKWLVAVVYILKNR